jgi:predicted dehydrogenase
MIRIGVIGAGGIAGVHLENLKTFGNVKIAALADPNERALKSRHDLFGGNAYRSLEEMLDTEDLDGVLLCTPAPTRLDPIRACADRRVPLFIEKPPALDLETASQVETILTEAELPHCVGFMYRWTQSVQKARRIFEDRPLYALSSYYLCDMMYPEPRKMLAPTYYHKEQSGGLVGEQGIHLLDLFRFLTRSEADRAMAVSNNLQQPKTEEIDTEETVSMLLSFENGVVANHLHSWAYPGWEVGLRLFGEGVHLFIDLVANRIVGAVDGVDFEEASTDSIHLAEMRAFIAYLESGDPAAIHSTYPDAVKTLSLAAAVNQSLEEGRSLNLSERDE